jgi:striatin 1/3/4
LEFGISEYELISGSHDGTIRTWDMRTFNLISDISSHRVKNNEGVLGINVVSSSKTVFSCGADGIIKAFSYN